MTASQAYVLQPIGFVRSPLTDRETAPRQGFVGAPDAWLEIDEAYSAGLRAVTPGQDIVVLTWLHLALRDVLEVHRRRHQDDGLYGVFATRSPDRPNPIGLHRVTLREMSGTRLRVGPLEALDGTPVLDIKPVLDRSVDS